MSWNPDLLATINGEEELEVTSPRPDGSLRPWVIVWMAEAGGELFVRSAHGPGGGWYRRALASGTGRIRTGGVEADVTFAPAPDADHAAIDADYHRKYDRYDPSYLAPVVGPASYPLTLRVDPA